MKWEIKLEDEILTIRFSSGNCVQYDKCEDLDDVKECIKDYFEIE